jgi:hypothetical protein
MFSDETFTEKQIDRHGTGPVDYIIAPLRHNAELDRNANTVLAMSDGTTRHSNGLA